MTMLTAEIDGKVEKKDETSAKPTSQEIGKIAEFIGEVRRGRMEWEVECFVNEMMKKGRHFVNDKGAIDTRDPHQLRRTVNKFRTMLRRMKNAVTFNDPIVDVLPEVGKEDDATPEELDMASWLCIREYKQNDFQSLIKQAVETAALKTWALVSVTPNDADDYRERLTICQTYDSLDVFFDNPDMSKAQRVVISSLEDRSYLKSMGYKVEGVSDTNASSHSYSKTRLDQISGKRGFTDKILIDQVFQVEYDEKDGVFDPKTRRIVHFVLAGSVAITERKILKDYKCLEELFHVYYLEEDQFDPYNPPWMSDVVPLQRSLNEASENTDTILQGFAKTRWKQRQGDVDNISVLQNRHMQVFRYDGAAPEPMEMPNPPQALFEVMGLRDRQIEDQVGQHGASMGVKEGTSSGRHAALIQAGDQDNMKEPADCLQKMLSWAFERVLEIGATNIDEVSQLYSPDGDSSHGVIGAAHAYEAEAEATPPEVLAAGGKAPKKKKMKADYMTSVALRAFKNIRVTVIPGSFFTLAQSKADFMELLPIVNNLGMKTEGKAMWKAMMRIMNVGLSRNIARLVENEEKKIEVGNADWVIAEQEFLKMSNGDAVTATPEQDHEVHLRVKVPALQAIVERYGKDNDAYYTILKNIQQHYQMMQMKRGQAPEAVQAIETAAAGGTPNQPGREVPIPPTPQEVPAGGPLPLPVAGQ